MDTTCNHTLYAMTDVFNEFFRKLAPLLLKDLLAQYEWCVLQDNDQLARSAASCLEYLPRPLYLGSGLPDLQAKAVLGNTSSFNAKALCRLQINLEL